MFRNVSIIYLNVVVGLILLFIILQLTYDERGLKASNIEIKKHIKVATPGENKLIREGSLFIA